MLNFKKSGRILIIVVAIKGNAGVSNLDEYTAQTHLMHITIILKILPPAQGDVTVARLTFVHH